MGLQRRALALASTTLTACALFVVTGPASADPRTAHHPDMTRMHEFMRYGNPGTLQMHERTMTSSGMHSH